jgi:hypothetical protein
MGIPSLLTISDPKSLTVNNLEPNEHIKHFEALVSEMKYELCNFENIHIIKQ